jgi:hypothetical protein
VGLKAQSRPQRGALDGGASPITTNLHRCPGAEYAVIHRGIDEDLAEELRWNATWIPWTQNRMEVDEFVREIGAKYLELN